MFDSIGIIELDTSQNRALAGAGKATRKKTLGRSRDVDTMKVRYRRTRSRGSVSTTTTTTTMITTCVADRFKYLLQTMKEYVPDLIPTTEVINLLLRCYSNCLGPTPPGEGGEGESEEDKSVGYLEKSLSLIRDMESIRDQAKAEETASEANAEGGEEEDDDWDENFRNTIQ